jgi:hypothetical protein
MSLEVQLSDSNYLSLTVAVLDPENLHEGQYVNMNGHLFVVGRLIEGQEAVPLRPVIGFELMLYHVRRHAWKFSVLLGVLAAALGFFIFGRH